MAKKKSNAGRKSKKTKETLQKLKEWFLLWLTDEECALYADISTTSLYNYQKENPKLLEQKKVFKNNPKLKARINLVNSILDWDIDNSKWYLERKAKDEFSTKQEVDQKTEHSWEIWIKNILDDIIKE